MYDHRQITPKKVSWLYAVTFGPFGFLSRFIRFAAVSIAVKTKRYKPQLGNPEVPLRWLQNATPILPNQCNKPGMIRDNAQSTPTTSTPEITRTTILDDVDSLDSVTYLDAPNIVFMPPASFCDTLRKNCGMRQEKSSSFGA